MKHTKTVQCCILHNASDNQFSVHAIFSAYAIFTSIYLYSEIQKVNYKHYKHGALTIRKKCGFFFLLREHK